MKKFILYISTFLTVTAISFSSCKKEFLELSPYDAIPLDQAIKSETDLEVAVTGIYASLRTSAMHGRTWPMMGDVMADNVFISPINTGRYIAFNSYVITSSTGEAQEIWESAYKTILRANQCINADLISNPNIKQLKGEAYTLRALMYFNLITCYARPYASGQGLPGVPIVLDYNPASQPARNSIGEVYNLIVADLNAAINNLSVQKKSEYISPWVAKALLSKVYQYMGDWTNAQLLANAVVNASGYKLADTANYLKYWASPAASNKSETLFEIALDGTNNNGTNSLTAMYFQPAYGDAICDSGFYKTFSVTDIRYQQMTPGTHHGIPGIIVKKYTNHSNSADKDDIKVLRLSEIYLLLAEAYYNMGDETNALLYLNTLAQKRDPAFSGYVSGGMQLLIDITNERRKELAFEGNRFFDLNRLGLDVNRGPEYPSTALNISFNDYRRILPIPLAETDANPNITQNPGY